MLLQSTERTTCSFAISGRYHIGTFVVPRNAVEFLICQHLPERVATYSGVMRKLGEMGSITITLPARTTNEELMTISQVCLVGVLEFMYANEMRGNQHTVHDASSFRTIVPLQPSFRQPLLFAHRSSAKRRNLIRNQKFSCLHCEQEGDIVPHIAVLM